MVLGSDRGESAAIASDFAAQFGVTFPILAHPTASQIVYQDYLINNCASPFPRDFVIDPEGRIAYVSCEYDPVALIDVIDELTGAASAPGPAPGIAGRQLRAIPNPLTEAVTFIVGRDRRLASRVEIFDSGGRRVADVTVSPSGRAAWDGRDARGRLVAPGVYFGRLVGEKLAVRLVVAR